MWLRGRLNTAERGSDQLDRKLRILITEQQRLRDQAEQCRAEWITAAQEAQTWLLRATLLGGQDAIRTAAPAQPAQVEVLWATAMGLRYPTDARLGQPLTPAPGSGCNAAIPPARIAFGAALTAGARTAAAEQALRLIDTEVGLTRRRLRALQKRWLPMLREALATLELSLEQSEQEDSIRLRRAMSSAVNTAVSTAGSATADSSADDVRPVQPAPAQ
jgi:V/A-type H+-transporting ATPase subunit D